MIARAARLHAERIALVADGKRMTFAEINERSNRIANGLSTAGLKIGDRVGIVTKNCIEYLEIEYALSKGGFVAVPLNSTLPVNDHLLMLKDSGASALFIGREHKELASVRAHVEGIRHVFALGTPRTGEESYESLVQSGSSEEPESMKVLTNDSLHNIMYTSGTTGRPKGVIHTHGVKRAVAINLLTDLTVNREDRLLHVAPLTHGTGFFALAWFLKGATNAILPEFDARIVCETIEKERITVFKVVPTILTRLLAFPDLDKYDLSSLHTIIYGASPMPPEKLRRGLERFGPVFVQIYGQTEALVTICTLGKEDHVVDGPEEQVRRLAAAGRPFTNVEVRIVDPDGKDLPPESVGEVVVKGEITMKGYWNLPEETAQTLHDGWVSTRDLGFMDSRGYVFLVDRTSDMLISGGLNIYPREIEDVIYTHPAVHEAAVFGVPDEDWGEAVKACVVLRPGAKLTAEELIAFCGEKLAPYKKPKSIVFLPELPKSAYGKILKTRLREPYWVGHGRRIH